MNESGLCASMVQRRRGISPASMLVVVDDIDLPVGQIRIRPGGGAGTHNGLRSIEQALGTESYPRLRIGVGDREGGRALKDHVLGTFRPEERESIENAVVRATEAIQRAATDGLDAAMTAFNQKRATPSPADGEETVET